MLGRDHALTGAAGFLATGQAMSEVVSHHPMPVKELLVGTIVCAAFALVPDMDEENSTVARKFGFISREFARFTKACAGGHRQATHSIFGAAIVGALIFWAASYRDGPAVIVGLSALIVLKQLLGSYKIRISTGTTLVAAGLIAYWTYASQSGHSWLALVAVEGVLWHMIGDSLTVEGVPWFWFPFVKRLQRIRLKAAILGHCGSYRESWVAIGLMVAILGLLWVDAGQYYLASAHAAVLQQVGQIGTFGH